jgi:outer membrane protein assembly factor BamB
MSSRREFLGWSAATGIGVVAGCTQIVGENGENGPSDSPTPSQSTQSTDTVDVEWTTDTGQYVNSLDFSQSSLYAGIDGSLLKLNQDGGTEQWSTDVQGTVRSSIAIRENSVYATGNADNGYVYAFDAEDGSKLWDFTKSGNRNLTSPTVSDQTVLVGQYDAATLALSADEGSVSWVTGVDGGVYVPPVTNSGTAYIGNDDGDVWALSVEDGSRVWNTEVGGGLVAWYLARAPSMSQLRVSYTN